MSKTLLEIIEAVKDGEKPAYEDLLYGLLALAHLQTFDGQDMLEVYSKSPDVPFGLKFLAEENFNRRKRALAVPPKEYIGDSFDPANPAYQEERKMLNKLANKIFET